MFFVLRTLVSFCLFVLSCFVNSIFPNFPYDIIPFNELLPFSNFSHQFLRWRYLTEPYEENWKQNLESHVGFPKCLLLLMSGLLRPQPLSMWQSKLKVGWEYARWLAGGKIPLPAHLNRGLSCQLVGQYVHHPAVSPHHAHKTPVPACWPPLPICSHIIHICSTVSTSPQHACVCIKAI